MQDSFHIQDTPHSPSFADSFGDLLGLLGTEDAKCCSMIQLFGPESYHVPIYGSEEALSTLALDASHFGLCVRSSDAEYPGDVLHDAYQHLQKFGLFPSHDSLRNFYAGRYAGDSHEAHELASQRFRFHPTFTGVLATLTGIADYHNSDGYDTQMDRQQYRYQIGIVTKHPNAEHPPHFEVRLCPCEVGVPATGTVWLYHEYGEDADERYGERWRAFSDEHQGGELQETEHTADLVAGITLEEPVLHNDEDPIELAQLDIQAAVSPSPTVEDSSPAASSERTQSINTENLTFDQILAGPLDHGAKLVTGKVVLSLARHHSNTDIFNRLNAALRAQGKTELKNSNVITRRITVAITSLAAKSSRTADDIRNELKAAKRGNGVTRAMGRQVLKKRMLARGVADAGDRVDVS